MRAIAASSGAALVILAALVYPARAGSANAADAAHAPLPAPIRVQTGAGTFEIERDRHIARLPAPTLPYPHDAAVFPAGVWYVLRHGHIEVGRGMRALWRSRGAFPSRLQFGVVTIGANTVAFSYRRGGSEQLYVARLGHQPERRVVRGEFPLGWGTGGFFTYRYRGRQLRLRSETGALVSTLVRGVSTYEYDGATQRLYYVDRDRLLSAAGPSLRPIASLAALGLRPHPAPALIPADGLVELLGSNRLVLLRADGSQFAQARIALAYENISSSSVALAPSAEAVAYTVLSGSEPASGTETVYVLRAGAHVPDAVYRQRISGGCERGAGVLWHGHWLLYTTSEGYVVVVDGIGKHRALELTRIVKSLPGGANRSTAYWTGQAPAL